MNNRIGEKRRVETLTRICEFRGRFSSQRIGDSTGRTCKDVVEERTAEVARSGCLVDLWHGVTSRSWFIRNWIALIETTMRLRRFDVCRCAEMSTINSGSDEVH